MSVAAETIFLRSLAIQLRVIYALLLREIITRYGRHGLGILWIVVEPMLFTSGVSLLWYLTKLHTVSSIPIVAFSITGYSSVLLWRNIAFRCSKAIEPNLALMYHRNVKVIDLLLSRIILEWIGVTTSFFILTISCWSFGWMNLPQDIFIVLLGWILLALFSLGLGLVVGAISELSETFERTWHVVTYLLFPLSGAVFMVDWLPNAAQKVVLWLPMVHGVEMIRHGYFGSVVPTYESVSYLILSDLILMLIGLVLVKETSKRVQPE